MPDAMTHPTPPAQPAWPPPRSPGTASVMPAAAQRSPAQPAWPPPRSPGWCRGWCPGAQRRNRSRPRAARPPPRSSGWSRGSFPAGISAPGLAPTPLAGVEPGFVSRGLATSLRSTPASGVGARPVAPPRLWSPTPAPPRQAGWGPPRSAAVLLFPQRLSTSQKPLSPPPFPGPRRSSLENMPSRHFSLRHKDFPFPGTQGYTPPRGRRWPVPGSRNGPRR